MESIFFSPNAQAFFSSFQRSFKDMPEFISSANRALSHIAEDMSIAYVKCTLTSPSSIFREKDEFMEHILYDSDPEKTSDEYVTESYINGDKGVLCVEIYKVKDAVWSDSDRAVLKTICHQIYQAGSSVVTNRLINSAVTTNLLMKLPNQTGFMGFAGRIMSQHNLADYDAFYFNIKNFKYVNTVLPFSQENDVLKVYAAILKKELLPEEILAHLGSDNFCALILKTHSDEFISILQNFTFTYEYDNEKYIFTFGATIGGAHLDNDTNPGQMMMNINVAYLMARQNRTSLEYYTGRLFVNIMRDKEILAKFRPVIKNEEFVIYYQPKVRVQDRTICGAEALVRWNQNGNIISPAEFIPVFEKEGCICELDFYVLEKVCIFLKKYIDSGKTPIRISTNFSRNHLKNHYLARDIAHILDKYEIPHKYIEVELTESEDFRDYRIMEKIVNDLREIGISTSIDDFGTGYSSLNMLKRTQLDIIKIDKSFIPDGTEYPNKDKDFIMFKQIVEISKSLGMETIAEGVETSIQYDYLKNVKCDIVQGYLFDKPLPENEFIERLKKGCYS